MLEVYYLQLDYKGRVTFDWCNRTHFINTFVTNEMMYLNQLNRVAVIDSKPLDKLNTLKESETYIIVYDKDTDDIEDEQVVKVGLTKDKIIAHLLELKHTKVTFRNFTILKNELISLEDFKKEVSLTENIFVINKREGILALDVMEVVRYLFKFHYLDLKDKFLTKHEEYKYSDLECFLLEPNETLDWIGRQGTEIKITEVVKALDQYPLINIKGKGRHDEFESRTLSRSDMASGLVDLSFWFKDILIESVHVTSELSLLDMLGESLEQVTNLYKMIFKIIDFSNFENPFEFSDTFYAFNGSKVKPISIGDVVLDYYNNKEFKYIAGFNNKCITRRLNVERFRHSDLYRLNDFLVVLQVNDSIKTIRMNSDTLIERLRTFKGQVLPPYTCVIPVANFIPIDEFVMKSRILSIKDILNELLTTVQNSLTIYSKNCEVSKN